MHVCKCNCMYVCMYVCMYFEFLYIDISIYNSTPQTKIFDSILGIYMHVCKCNCMYVCVLNFSVLIYQYVIRPTKLKFLAPPLIVNIWYKIASELEVLTEELPEYSHF